MRPYERPTNLRIDALRVPAETKDVLKRLLQLTDREVHVSRSDASKVRPVWTFTLAPPFRDVQVAVALNAEKVTLYIKARNPLGVDVRSELGQLALIEQQYPNPGDRKPPSFFGVRGVAPGLQPDAVNPLLRVAPQAGRALDALNIYLGVAEETAKSALRELGPATSSPTAKVIATDAVAALADEDSLERARARQPMQRRNANLAQLTAISELARGAVACSHCFLPARLTEWNSVPARPADRPDDVAAAPWVGPKYLSSSPRIAVVMLNPGQAAARHKLVRRDLGQRLREGNMTFAAYTQGLAPLVSDWGFGAVSRWITAVGLSPDNIAFLNMALCAVANDAYFPKFFEACFARHTRNIIATLEPEAVVLCGKQELAAFVSPIRALGPHVILTWHYRPMNTTAGQREIARVRGELSRLSPM